MSRLRSEEDEPVRTGSSRSALARALVDNLQYLQGRVPEMATKRDWYAALAYTVRDRIIERWIETVRTLFREDVKVVAYLSAEFLIGPQLGSNLLGLGIEREVREVMASLDLDLDEILEQEEEPGLGNGGLGRLAACYLDSLATLEVPAIGYGIRYEFGIFDQVIRDGWQVETTDKWLRGGFPWEIARPDVSYRVPLGGHTEAYRDEQGRDRVRWIPHRVVQGVAHDVPVLGYGTNTVNLLRLWTAEAVESFDFEAFNVGDYFRAVDEKVASETISKVLYPNDEPWQGKMLRLAQQMFFVSCSLQDMIRIHLRAGRPLDLLDDKFAIQLNDTHPAIAVAELMRLLLDEHGLDWDAAWQITRNALAYTNHTLLPEALETWPLPLFAQLLPRHLELVYEINRRHLDEVRVHRPGDDELVRRVSLIDESGEKRVRMANLAVVGSHAVNGVAALHTELLKETVLRDFASLHPERFLNVTNGVTPRRWMALANPELAALLDEAIGTRWRRHAEDELAKLEPLADDASFRERWRRMKRANKARLARRLGERTGVAADPDTLFDVQVKRIHEYKRQQLNVLHVIALYEALREGTHPAAPPRTVVFGGKAAPAYRMAKLVIKLIHAVADVVNADPLVGDRLRVVFLPDFNVKNAHPVYPGADLSEQISTAGKEASGTGNMKFGLGGALTIGTLDGANVEIREAVGSEHFFLFGLTADEVRAWKARGYDPGEVIARDARLGRTLALLESGFFSHGDRDLFRPLVDSIRYGDEYMVCADFASYVDRQHDVEAAFLDAERWTRSSILNVARLGAFSSDRSVREYCEKVWRVQPVRVVCGGR